MSFRVQRSWVQASSGHLPLPSAGQGQCRQDRLRVRRVPAAVVALVGLAVCGPSIAPAATEIRLHAQARCGSAVVRLGDVAEILSDDPHLAAILAEIPLRPAPAAGAALTVSRQEVRQLLLLSGVAPATLDLTGSDQVAIQHAPAVGPMAPRRGLVAEGVRQATLERELAADERAALADLRPTRGLRPVPPQVLARGASPSGEPAADAADRPLVERGAQVSVVARTAGIRVTTTGKALEAGKAGQRIQVELDDSKQRVLARVVGWQAVEVAVGGTDSAALPLAAAGDTSRPAR
jgi:hypothetical protein